jgi:hypothetical protein
MILNRPTPPTSTEIRATPSNRLPVNCNVAESAQVIFAMSRTLKSSS